MTQVFDNEGRVHPATVLSAGPAVVVQIKSKDKDGYEAVQIGSDERNAKRISKAVKGHLKDLGNLRHLREFRLDKTEGLERGAKVEVSQFVAGEKVAVSGVSKGKGFQGVVKRHGFAGGPRTHGQKHSEREPGSIGVGGVQRVLKGTRMAGRMGGERITVKNLRVLQADSAQNLLILEGAVPGRRGTLVEVRG